MLSLGLLLAAVTPTLAQFTFGVAPGLVLNGATVGYKVNDRWMPYFGFQYVSAGFGFEENGKRLNPANNQIEDYTTSNGVNAHVLIPSLGAKYFLTQQNQLKTYLNANMSMPFLFGSADLDGAPDEPFEEDLRNVSLFGGELGFGVEYFFDDNFSIGGEFGLRHLRLRYRNEFERTIFRPGTPGTTNSEVVLIEQQSNFSLSPTYSRISLNFYF